MAIKTKDELKQYIEQDEKRYQEKRGIVQNIIYPPNRYLEYQRCLRKAEYYCNTGGGLKYYFLRRLHRLGLITGIDIPINVVGKGLHLPHGKVVISALSKIGDNCTIYSDVTIGVDWK